MRLSLSPSTDVSDYSFVHSIRTRFAETDAMGIIHHAAYLPYLEEARAALLRHLGHPYDRVRDDGIDFAVLEAYLRYRMPLRFDEVVDVHVKLGNLTRRDVPGRLPPDRGRRGPGHGGHRPRCRGCVRPGPTDAVLAGPVDRVAQLIVASATGVRHWDRARGVVWTPDGPLTVGFSSAAGSPGRPTTAVGPEGCTVLLPVSRLQPR